MSVVCPHPQPSSLPTEWLSGVSNLFIYHFSLNMGRCEDPGPHIVKVSTVNSGRFPVAMGTLLREGSQGVKTHLAQGQHHALGWSPGLSKKEKMS